MDLVARLSSSGVRSLLDVPIGTLGGACVTGWITSAFDTFAFALSKIDCSMLISLFDLSLVALFKACWQAAIAFMSLSFADTDGLVIRLCWNCTVSLNLSLFVALI